MAAARAEEVPLSKPLLTRQNSTVVLDVGDESDESEESNTFVTILNASLRSAAHLANLLPTSTFLLFQILVPIFSNSGNCETQVDTYLTAGLLTFCGLLCFVSSFTDSFTTKSGKVRYGVVTWFGLWTPQLKQKYVVAEQFKLEWKDAAHSILAVLVFYTSTIFSPNVRYCFFPDLTDRISNLVCNLVPPLAGFLVSIIFILVPSERHGFGYPVTVALLASVQKLLSEGGGAGNPEEGTNESGIQASDTS